MCLVTNIQKYSIHDGDGIRTTVFFKGCPLRCAWCHNPETQKFERQILTNREKCTGCMACVNVCPNGAISIEDGKSVTDYEIMMIFLGILALLVSFGTLLIALLAYIDRKHKHK